MFNRNFAAAAPRIFSARPPVPRSSTTSFVQFLGSALHRLSVRRRRRREREELHAFLAGDHRIAADIGYRHQQRE